MVKKLSCYGTLGRAHLPPPPSPDFARGLHLYFRTRARGQKHKCWKLLAQLVVHCSMVRERTLAWGPGRPGLHSKLCFWLFNQGNNSKSFAYIILSILNSGLKMFSRDIEIASLSYQMSPLSPLRKQFPLPQSLSLFAPFVSSDPL